MRFSLLSLFGAMVLCAAAQQPTAQQPSAAQPYPAATPQASTGPQSPSTPQASPPSQASAVPPTPLANLAIPAELKTTIHADKAHVGDVVRFKSIEAVLLGKGLVMPANTALIGRVLGASPHEGKNPSWICIVVDRAEWKDHVQPLHAFIFGQIAHSGPQAGMDATTGVTNPGSSPNQLPLNRRRNLGDPRSAIAAAHQNDDAMWDREANMAHAVPHDIKLARHKSGTTFLLSEKHNLKLSSGIFFMLQNVPLQTPLEKTASTSQPAPVQK